MFVSAIIVAGGSGTRIKSINVPKQFYMLDDKTVLYYSVKPFNDLDIVDEIIVVTLKSYISFCEEELSEFKKITKITVGGSTRQQSVFNGLNNVGKNCTLVTVHDGARPFITANEIISSINEADGCATVCGTNVVETIKRVNSEQVVEGTPDRDFLRAVQTPQVIPYKIFKEAHRKAQADGFIATDDVSLAEYIGYPVKIVEGRYDNIKITTDRDLQLAKLIKQSLVNPHGISS